MPSSRRRASGPRQLLVLLTLLLAAASTSAELLTEDAKDLMGPNASPGVASSSADEAKEVEVTPAEEEEIEEETEQQLSKDGVKVNLPEDELEAGDNVTMKYADGEVVNVTVTSDADTVTEAVGGGGQTHTRTHTRTDQKILTSRFLPDSWRLHSLPKTKPTGTPPTQRGDGERRLSGLVAG
jgi:hypothetical protein